MNRKKTKLILIIIFFTGLSILLYPFISQYWNSFVQSKAIDDYTKLLSSMKNKDYSNIFLEADNYNQKLSNLNFPLIQYKNLPNYFNLLNINNNGMMGYISIDKIKVKIPIYHGTSSAVLNVAVGHLEGSSLPVGGNSTHSVLSAHRGLPSARLFTDLNKLELGDIFEITIIDRKITYQIDNIVVTKPNDVSELEIIDGKDYVTLLTCTPYGLNTHRLLVRGKRIENIDDTTIYITTEAFKISNLIVTSIIALPISIILLSIITLKPIKNKENKLEKYLDNDKNLGGKNND